MEIVIGLFTDSAIAEYKSLPLIDYSQRLEIMKILRVYLKLLNKILGIIQKI